MQKLSIILFLLFPILCFSQDYISQIPQENGNVQFEKILEFKGQSAQDLYSSARLMISDLYNSGKTVIDLADDKNYVLVVKGLITYPLKDVFGTINQKLDHTLKLQFKDGRMRVIFKDLIVNRTIPVENIVFPNKTFRMPKKIREKHAKEILAVWNNLIQTINSKMLNSNTDNNW